MSKGKNKKLVVRQKAVPTTPIILHPVPARRFYFAYGSNLCERNMTQRCKSARKVGAFKLWGWRLVFRYVADIEPGELTDYVPGGIWEITPPDEIELDRYEGARYGEQSESGSYRKLSFPIATKTDGSVHDVLVYQMTEHKHEKGVLPPGEWYFNTIARGYREFGLNLDKLNEALELSWRHKRITKPLSSRWNTAGQQTLKGVPERTKPVQVELPYLDVDAPTEGPVEMLEPPAEQPVQPGLNGKGPEEPKPEGKQGFTFHDPWKDVGGGGK